MSTMDLTLKNFQTVLSKELLKQAEKARVRECDETEKGHYIAYVDEGPESYDVSLVLSPKKEVTEHRCECKNNNTFCRHKAALLLYIAGGQKAKAVVKTKKKESKVETLLEEADPSDLKEWVKEVLQKNKDIALSFVHYFSARQQQYTPEDIVKITNDAIKAVVGNKKNVDPTQLKRLTDLWNDVHAPVVRNYHSNAADEHAFLCFHALLESCRLYQTRINTNSNRITKYVEGVLQQSAESIHQIVNEEAWNKAVNYFMRQVPEGGYRIRLHYLLHLKNVISISTEERKQRLIASLTKQYNENYSDSIYEAYDYTRIIFGIVEENGLMSKYYWLFRPIRFDNEFNLQLIRMLIRNNEMALAEIYCYEQIEGNYREEYNIPYLFLLREIYKQQNDEEKLSGVLTSLFPYSYDFDDYLFITDRLPEEERKKWRTNILSRARNASNNHSQAATKFVFQLLDYEKQYLKMIDAINSYTPYQFLIQYFEPMVLTNKNRLLKALMDKHDHYGFGLYYEDAQKDAACFPGLFEAMLKHYGEDVLMMAVEQAEKGAMYHRRNPFIKYLKERLLAGK